MHVDGLRVSWTVAAGILTWQSLSPMPLCFTGFRILLSKDHSRDVHSGERGFLKCGFTSVTRVHFRRQKLVHLLTRLHFSEFTSGKCIMFSSQLLRQNDREIQQRPRNVQKNARFYPGVNHRFESPHPKETLTDNSHAIGPSANQCVAAHFGWVRD